MVGQEIGSYTLVSKIGEGGMGAVFLGEHKLLRRKAAVKLLLKEFNEDENIVKRFINEAKATSQILHPGIVQIYDFGKAPDGSTYMIMELLEGETLHARVRKRRKLAIADAVAIIRQMASALAAAHALNVVHRDLKPENVFLVPDDTAPRGERVKLLDFGIAKMLDPGVSAPHTKTGSILGTPIYMSPEQCTAQPKVDHRADLYAVGCVFFHLLCGRPPFDLSGIGELLGAHVYTPPPVPSTITAEIPPGLDAIILKLLAKKPDERYASAQELIEALDAVPLDSAAKPAAEAAPETLGPMRSTPEAATMVASPHAAVKPIEPPRKTPMPALTAEVGTRQEPRREEPRREPTPTADRPRKEITTLGGAAGESAIPQPERRRSNSMVTMGVAFGLTVSLALGGFFLFGRRSVRGAGGAVPMALVTLSLDSDPVGAEIYRDGAFVGVTPFELKAPPAPGDANLVFKLAGYGDARLVLPADHDAQRRVTLAKKDGGT